MSFGLRHVISGILAGGIPGFRMVLCCFSHLCVWPCVCLFSPDCFVCFLAFLAILGCDGTMPQCCHHLHESTNELGASHSRVSGFGLFWFCFLVLCVLVCFVSLLFAWFMMMTAQ